MALQGKRINQLAVAATSIEDDDLFGIDQDIGGGVFQTKKAKRKLLPNISMVSRTSDLLRTPAAGIIDDPELIFPVIAGATYLIQGRLIFVAGGGSAAYTRQWITPALTSGILDWIQFESVAGVAHSYSVAPFFLAFGNTAGNDAVLEDRLIIIPSAAGNVAVRWGSTVTGVTIKAGSFLQIQKFVP
ncbi:MAG TPA: hypothetical protein VFU31_21065 [Candidatus Binatia bacterium]|nr:hypothetical protein [Candidatus Binatia bacterium]